MKLLVFKKGSRNSTNNLKFLKENQKIPFYFLILYATYYNLIKTKEGFGFYQDEDKLSEFLGQDIFEELKAKKKHFYNLI